MCSLNAATSYQKGEVIVTGSLTIPINLAAGGSVSFEIQGVGDVNVNVT